MSKISMKHICSAGFGKWNVGMMPNNPQWKMSRMQYHQVLSVERVKQWRQKQTHGARMFALAMLDHPEDFFKNIR
jgi:signal-transduction protein with cAMP-binding, CBS, and nucleotidyltransferase domain